MANPIVALVYSELIWFEEVLKEDRNRLIDERIFPDKENLHPMPFFGDIRRAEVLTVALNPAHTEFDAGRWPIPAFGGSALTTRLLHYFDLPEPEPHSFFKRCSQMLLLIHSNYPRNAAHIDLSSLPTFMPSEMTDQQRPIFAKTVLAYAARLNEVLRLATNTKLILVIDFHVRDGMDDHLSVWETLLDHCPMVKLHADQDGEALPILRADNLGALTAAVLRNRHEILEHLNSSPPLVHPSHE